MDTLRYEERVIVPPACEGNEEARAGRGEPRQHLREDAGDQGAGRLGEGRGGQTDCTGGLVTGPEVELSPGCFVGPELIEGES